MDTHTFEPSEFIPQACKRCSTGENSKYHVPDKLTEAQRRFVELDRRKVEYKQFLEDLKSATEALVAESGVGTFFQDEQGIVYQTAEATRRFVYYERYTVNRTRREGEAKGSLSAKTAREAGFTANGLESIEAALREITERFADADKVRSDLQRRRNELLQGAREARRRRARSTLDAFLPPITFVSIETAPRAAPPPVLVEMYQGRRFYVAPSAWMDRPFRVRDRALKSIVKDFRTLAEANACARGMDDEHYFEKRKSRMLAAGAALLVLYTFISVVRRYL